MTTDRSVMTRTPLAASSQWNQSFVSGRRLALSTTSEGDLHNVTLVDRAAVEFLAGVEVAAISTRQLPGVRAHLDHRREK